MTLKNKKNAKKIRKKILYIFIVESRQDLFSRTNFEYIRFPRQTRSFAEAKLLPNSVGTMRIRGVHLGPQQKRNSHIGGASLLIAAPRKIIAFAVLAQKHMDVSILSLGQEESGTPRVSATNF